MISLERRERRVRGLDLALVTVTAPIWLTAVGLLAIAVLVTSGRPIFFTQQRIGKGRRPFTMIKFRTMLTGPNPLVPDETRITAIGRLLRRTSLDELPQLFNVIAGHMSLVGPRPMPAELGHRVGRGGSLRFAVRPGMTGIAQVNGRNAISWDQRIAHDQEWVGRIGAITALRVLAQTVRVVVSGSGIAGHDRNDPFLVDVADVEPLMVDHVDAGDTTFDRWAA